MLFFIKSIIFAQLTYLPFLETNIEGYIPDNIKRIMCKKGKELSSIMEFDKTGKLIFRQSRLYRHPKSEKAELIYVSGYIYNDEELLVKEYALQSNAYLFFYYYDYDSLGRKSKETLFEYQHENHLDLINTNPYMFITEIQTMEILLSHGSIREMEQKSRIQHTCEYRYDVQGNLYQEIYERTTESHPLYGNKYTLSFEYDNQENLIQEIWNNDDGSRRYRIHEYDDNNNVCYSRSWNTMDNKFVEVFNEYEKPIRIRSHEEDGYSLLLPPPMPLNHYERKCKVKTSSIYPLLQCIRIEKDSIENIKNTTITHYSYDKRNLIDERKFVNGEFQEFVHFEYNDCNQVVQRDHCRYNINNPLTRQLYKYNKNCFVKQIKIIDGNNDDKIKFKYKLEFYDEE